jgi:tetratricopeptide (TPR) repeat protein
MRTLVLTMCLAWQAVSPEAVTHAKAGLEARQAGHLPEAVAEFKKVTEFAPDFPAGFVNLGAALLESREYAAAIVPLKRALELDPKLVGAEQMLGYALLSAGYAAEAIPHLEKTQSQDALGIAQLKTGKLPEAIANLNAALAKRPNDPELLYYLGRASGLLSKEVFDTLESAYPDSARAHESLAENYAALRKVSEAEAEYQKALDIRPDAPGIHLALGELYALASDWPKAEDEFRAEAKLQPGDAETAYRLGAALLQNGKTKDAKAQLQIADQLRPQMPETLLSLGKAALLEGDIALAEKEWKQVVAIEKSGPLAEQAHFSLAGLYRKKGQTAQAEQEMEIFRAMRREK